MLIDTQEQFDKAQTILMNPKATQDELSFAFDIFSAFQNIKPKNPLAIFGMATCCARRKQYALAVLLYEVYLQLQPVAYLKAGAWLNLGQVHHYDGRKKQAIECFHKAIELCEGHTEEEAIDTVRMANINIAGSCVSTGEPDMALESVEGVLQKWPDAPEIGMIKLNKAFNLLEMGDYAKGFDIYHEYEGRHICRDYIGEGSPPTWDGTTELDGRKATVMIYGEQGIGDEIMFASMIPDLMKDCNVVMDAHLRLADMFRRSFNIPVYATREFNMIRWKYPGKIDYKLPIGSLGKWYRREADDFPGTPYIKADEKLREKLKIRLKQLGDKPCIGISWRGGTKSTNGEYRNINLDLLKPLLRMDVNWISLNYQQTTPKKLEEFCGKTGLKIHHFKDAIDDYDMTAALVSELDLVISVPQSVVHLAGAIGTPVWQMCPKKAMWQVGPYGENMPWYKCAKNFWQDDSEKWEPVIENIKGELCSLLAKNIAA